MNNTKGQSVLEIIIAIGFMAIIVLVLSRLLAGNINIWQAGSDLTQAKQLAQEQIEAVYSLRLADWHNLFQYATSTAKIINGNWQLAGESEIGHKDKFSYWLEFSPVYRLADGSLALSESAQAYQDPLSRQITAKVSWQDIYQQKRTVQNFIYLTAWQAEWWLQTDWTGGDGQSIWQDDDKYWQAEGLIDTSTDGQISLNLASSTGLATGTLISSAFDTGSAHKFLSLSWGQEIPTDCNQCLVQVQIKTAADDNGQPLNWTSTWCGPDGDDGDEDDWFEQYRGELISADHNDQQWIKYRIKLIGDSDQAPIVEEIKIYYE